MFGKQILNCGPFTISPGWSESAETELEVQEGSWSHHWMRIPPVRSSKCNRSCCFTLRKNNCCVCPHIKRQDHSYLWIFKHSMKTQRLPQKTNTSSVSVGVFTVMLWWERNCICLMNWPDLQSMLGNFLEENLYSGVSSAAVNPTRLLLLSLVMF